MYKDTKGCRFGDGEMGLLLSGVMLWAFRLDSSQHREKPEEDFERGFFEVNWNTTGYQLYQHKYLASIGYYHMHKHAEACM